MPRREIPAERRAAILAAYEAGEKLEVIGLQHAVHPRYVYVLARRAGLPARQPRGTSRIGADTARAAVAGYAQGLTLRAIAERLCISADTVRRLVLASGTAMRPHGGARPLPAHSHTEIGA